MLSRGASLLATRINVCASEMITYYSSNQSELPRSQRFMAYAGTCEGAARRLYVSIRLIYV